MKQEILESMDKGIWYCYDTLAAITGFTRGAVNRTCLALAAEKVIEIDVINGKSRARLLMNRRAVVPAPRACFPTVATGPYRPKWKRLKAYDSYVLSHQRLCEELR